MASILKMEIFSCPRPRVAPPQTAVTTPAAHLSPGSIFRQSKTTTVSTTICSATRRRVRGDNEKEEEDDEYNEEIAALEKYSESKKGEGLLVQAQVDQELVQLLIFKGYSSCLSGETDSDPSRSILPSRAVIKRIDRVKAPFDPSNIEYIQKGLTLYDLF